MSGVSREGCAQGRQGGGVCARPWLQLFPDPIVLGENRTGPCSHCPAPPALLPREGCWETRENQRLGETELWRDTETDTKGKSVRSTETDGSLREPWALWEPGGDGKLEALCAPRLDFGSLTGLPPKQTIAGTLVRAQLVALNGFTSGTFLCLPASRLEVSQGARPRSCSQIPPPHSLGAKSKPATIGVGAIWLSSCPGRERSRLTGSRIGHHVTLGGGQSAKCLPWGRN